MLLLLLATSCAVCLTGVEAKKLDVCSVQLRNTSQDVSPDIVYYRTGTGGAWMHYAWSMIGHPSFYMSRTNVSKSCNESITYNRTDFVDKQAYGSVHIAGQDEPFSFALVFTRVIEFDDKHDKTSQGFDPNQANDISYWLNESTVRTFTFSGDTFHLSTNNSYLTGLEIKVKFPKNEGTTQLSEFPHTLYTDESSTFDLTIKLRKGSKPPDRHFKYGRVALEMMLVSGPGIPGGRGSLTESKWLDDEYTPSVFKTVKYEFGSSLDTEGFMAWKPISYQSSGRKSTVSQQANWVLPTGQATVINSLPTGLATALFQNVSVVGNATRLYMVFGTAGDETYRNPTYMTWTAAIGHGKPPTERISLAVIITISLGLGIPGLVIIAGGTFVFVKKKPWENVVHWTSSKLRRRQGYTRVNG